MKDMTDAPHQPHSIEAEQQLLGAILGNNALLPRVADFLLPEHFYDPVHGLIYRTAAARIRKGHIASPVTLKTTLGENEGLNELGGAAYLVRLVGASIGASAIREYGEMIVGLAARRKLLAALDDARVKIAGEDEVQTIAAGLQHALVSLPEAKGQESTLSMLKAVTQAIETQAAAYEGRGKPLLKTGIPALDAIVRGIAPGNIMLLGGATSMGKTSVAIEITRAVAEAGGPVAFVSLEMTADEITSRLVSQRSRIPYSDMRDPSTVEEEAFRKWVDAAKAVAELPVRIIPRHVRDIAGIHAAAHRAKMEFGDRLDLLVVDYAQLVRAEGRELRERMNNVSIGLKALAGLLDVPVIALVQLSRDIGSRDDKRPHLTDIRESGQFENDADQVVMCHREGYWLQRQGPRVGKDGTVSTEARADWEADMARHRTRLELIVRKNRHGRIATAEVGFHDATNRVWALGEDEEGFA